MKRCRGGGADAKQMQNRCSRGADVERRRGAEAQRCRCRCRGAGVVVQVQLRGAEMQTCRVRRCRCRRLGSGMRDAEVQRFRGLEMQSTEVQVQSCICR